MRNNFFKNMKIKQKVVFVFVITIALMWLAIVITAITSIRNIYNRKIDRITQQTVEQTSKYISTEYSNIINLVHYSVNMEDLQNVIHFDIDKSQKEYIYAQSIISPILSQLRMQNNFIESAGLVFKGHWFYGDIYTMSYDIDEIMEQVKMTPLIYWSKEIVRNQDTGKMVLPVIMKLPSGSLLYAENESYMVVNIDAEKMFDYIGELERNLQCYLTIHNGDDVIFGDEALFHSMDERQYIINNTEIAINGWTLTCALNRDEMYRDLNQTIVNMLLISGIIGILCIVMTNYVVTSITTPINDLMEVTKQLERGNFSVRANFDGRDEIGELGQSFNTMCCQIEQYIQMLEDEKQQVQISEEQKRRAELQALQSQINPHFLYNTLDSLYWYSLSGKKDEIGKIVIDLSQLLRIGLSKGVETITVENEIQHVKNYLEIEKIIFSDKFNYHIDYDDSVLSLRIIKILLQPLVENSLNHGFSEMEFGGEIHITLFQEDTCLVIRVADNGRGFEYAAVKSGNEYSGYALSNISERLRLHYGEDAKLSITSKPYVETTVEIRISMVKLS